MIDVEGYSIDLVETCRFGLDGGAMFGVVPKALWERAYAPSDAKNRIPMAAKAMLIRGHGKTILVDTGNSPFMSPKLLDIYGVDFTTYTIEGSLQRLGVRTDDVTDVILTHLHFDHAGGAVVERDGEHLPRFSNATYHVQREHLQWALQPSLKDRASFMPEYYQPLIDHGRLSLVDGEGELFPHIHVHTVHGHTPFMQVLHVGGEEGVFYAADLIPTSAHVPLPYGMAYDNEPLKTIEEKQRFHPRMVEERWTVIFEHDALRQASRIVMGEKGVMLGDDVVITSYE